jgi:type IV fimbrial biogenesis protein FimT
MELLVTLLLVAVISAFGAPAFSQMIKNNRVKSYTLNLISDIQHARSEAVKRRVRVVMCRSANPLAAAPACGGSANTWTTGYLVFAAGDANNTFDAATDTLLRVRGPASSDLAVRTNSPSNQNLEIRPDGSTEEGGGIARFSICDSRLGAHGRQISVPPHGRLRLTSGTTGTPIQCTPA